jgi:hypothetical protein
VGGVCAGPGRREVVASGGARGGEVVARGAGWRGGGAVRRGVAAGASSERRRRQRSGEVLRMVRRQHLPCVGVLLRFCLREKSDASRAVARAGEEDGVFIPRDL